MADLNGQPQNPGMHQDVATPPVMETLQPTSANTEVDQVVQEDPAKMIQLLLTEMQELRQDFDTKVKYDESKEQVILEGNAGNPAVLKRQKVRGMEGDEVTGRKIIYLRSTGEYKVEDAQSIRVAQ